MPRGVHLSDKSKEQIYTSFTLGESPDDIAASMDLNPGTVRRIVREQRKLHERKREEMSKSGKIVKKDGNGGKLMALSPEGFEFTHVTPDGKSHKKKVPGHLSRVAEQQYDKWCEELDAECEFMRRVERKTDALIQDVDEQEPEAVCGYSNDPIEEIRPIQVIEPAPAPEINVRPWREVAEERQQRIEELEAKVAELEGSEPLRSDWVIERTEYEKPILEHWFNNNGAFRVFWMNKPVYVLWAKSDAPKIYGVYRTMEAALKEVDRLNEVASFLGSEGAFEVEEVAWKS